MSRTLGGGAILKYGVLGPLEVRDGERTIDLGSRKQRAVLALLLIHARRVVSVDALIDGLWGEAPPATAQGTLQAYISNLRKILEPERSRGEAPAVVVSQPPGYMIDVPEEDLDASLYESLAARGSALSGEGRFEKALKVLDDALALWRGPAYGDFTFEPFAREEIARLEELLMNVVENKVEAELALGRHRMLIGELRRWVEKEPLRERLRADLAIALYRDARQAEALATLREGREYLADELGIDPGPQLRDLEERMLNQDPALQWIAPPEQAMQVEDEQGLVGRRPELEVLSRAAQSARAGRGRILLIAGEPGIGKTALVEEFSEWDHGLKVRWGHCYEGEGAPPFWPWRQILEAVIESESPGAALDALGVRSADLVQLVPQLAPQEHETVREAAGDAEEARFRLYVAVASVLKAVAATHPLMIVLDDLHWSDSASLRLLDFVAKEIRRAHVLIVATYRDAEVEPDDPLGSVLASLARLPVVERVMLEGFDTDEVGSYIRSVIGSTPSGGLVEELHARTGGNPFFLSELLRLWQADGPEDERTQTIGGVPANIRDVILKRVGSLPPPTQRLLEQATVLGRLFDVEVLAALGETDEGETLDGMTPAVRSRLLIATDPLAGRYGFSHALVRDAIYEELMPGIRARLHLRAGEVLEELRGADPSQSADIAAHFSRATILGAADKAVNYGAMAADHAVSQLAYEDAEQQYRSALRSLERMRPGRERAVAELRLRQSLSNLLTLTRGYTSPEIAPTLERIRDLTDEVGDVRQRATALWASVTFYTALPDMNAALALSNALLQLAADSGDPSVEMLAHMARGRCGWQTGTLEEARHHLDLGVSLLDSIDQDFIVPMVAERDPETYCSNVLANVTWLQGDADEARAILEENLRRAKGHGHPLPHVTALGTCSLLGAYAGDASAVRPWIEELIEVSDRTGYPWYGLAGHALRGWAIASEDPAAGLAEMEDAVVALEASGSLFITGLVQPLFAERQLAADRPAEALRAVERGVALAEETGHRCYLAELYRIRGEALQATDPTDEEAIERALHKALEVARDQGAGAFESRIQQTLRNRAPEPSRVRSRP
jgi:DNA-binding SARP family transcriptional activator